MKVKQVGFMHLAVTLDFNFSRLSFWGSSPPQASSEEGQPNLGPAVASDITEPVRAEAVKPAQTNPKKSSLKRMIMIAAWIMGMVSGLSLAITGACTANPLFTQLGALIMTAFTGMGVKVVEYIVMDKD